MAGGVERFLEAAAGLGVDADVRRFPSGTRTAADAARAVSCDIGQIVKSLVFVADGLAFLALTSGPNRADAQAMAGILGAKEVRRASPDEARVATGFAIGGTPPFGHPARLRVLVDRDLMAYEVVWAAAGAPDAVFAIGPRELLETSGGEVVDLKERHGD